MKLFENQVVIVTGAGRPRGMGRATALKFASHGARVVVTDVVRSGHEDQDRRALEQVVTEVNGAGPAGLGVAVDVCDQKQIADCVEKTLEQFGTIDVLVNNAGTAIGAGPFLEQDDHAWDLSVRVNLLGVVNFCKAVIPVMQKSGGGVIVNNSSMLGLAAEPFTAAYTATKFGVVGLTKVIASEFGKDNIRCNTVCPGSVDTDQQAAGIEKFAKWYGVSLEDALADAERNALGRSASPEEVADVMVWLASPMSSFVSGAAIPVTGAANPGV